MLQKIVLYSADPWESVLPVLRVKSPAKHVGWEVIQGNAGDKINIDIIEAANFVVIQRDFPRFKKCLEVMEHAHRSGIPVIYELDDWLFEVPEANCQFSAYQEVLFSILTTIIKSDKVIVSTPFLYKHLQALNPEIYLFRNFLDDDLWTIHEPRMNQSGPVQIGYMGGDTHLADLEWLSPVFMALLEKYGREIQLKFCGGEPPHSLRHHDCVFWDGTTFLDYSRFVSHFSSQSCDIFVAPLVDSRFNRAKSAIKYLEYSALGIPGIFSRIDPYEEIILEGRNGFLASDWDEWTTKIEQLVASPELRFQMASEAQNVVQEYMLSKHASDWGQALSNTSVKPANNQSEDINLNSLLLHIGAQTQDRIWNLEDQLIQRNEEIAQLKGHREELKTQVEAILNSRTWKIARIMQRAGNAIPFVHKRNK